jgi:hypothetical protein
MEEQTKVKIPNLNVYDPLLAKNQQRIDDLSK